MEKWMRDNDITTVMGLDGFTARKNSKVFYGDTKQEALLKLAEKFRLEPWNDQADRSDG